MVIWVFNYLFFYLLLLLFLLIHIINLYILVDSVTIITTNGLKLKAGGDGGSNIKSFIIPQGWKFIGFIGGIGGHLHNIGISIINKSSSLSASSLLKSSAPSIIFNPLTSYILNQISKHGLYDKCILLNTTQYDNVTRNQPDIGKLLKLISSLFNNNSIENYKLCITTIIAYLDNISKHINELKYRKIKINNKLFRKTILSGCGIDFFLFGPAGFKLNKECTFIESNIKLISEGGDMNRNEWISCLNIYINFLIEIKEYSN
jgi:hypothetical protein